MRLLTLLSLIVLLAVGCGGAPTPDAQTVERAVQATLTAHAPAGAPAPSATPAPTDMPAPAAEPAVALTATVAPALMTDTLRNEVFDTYKLLVIIQADANLLDETANRVASGEVEGMDSYAAVMTVAMLTKAVDDAVSEHVPPAILKSFWEDATPIHDKTRTLATSWLSKEITSTTVISEIAAPLANIESVLSDVDGLLQNTYAWDRSDLQERRSQFIADFRGVMNTPTPLPESVASPVVVVSDASYTEGDYLHIIGEVKNGSDSPMEFVKVVATLYDDKDNVIGTESSYSTLDVLPPHGKSPFEIATSGWKGATRYKLQLQGREGDLPETPVKVISHQNRVEGDYYHIIGEVKNEGTSPVEFVKIIATLYDEEDRVVGVIDSYAELDAVPAGGGKSPFELTTDHWNGASHYEIQVQARPGEMGRQDIAIISHRASESSGYYSVVGEVQNKGLTKAEFVKVIVTLYDSAGKVVAAASSYTELDTISPGATSPFEVTTGYDPSFDHYEIQVQGR